MMGRGTIAIGFVLVGVSCGGATTTTPTSSSPPSSAPTGAPCVGATGSAAVFLAQGAATSFYVDDDYVFSGAIDGIVRVPRAGGAAVPLETDESPVVVAGDASSVYFFATHDVGQPDPQGKAQSGTALYSIPRAGGTRSLLVDSAYGTLGSSDGTTLTWASSADLQQLPVAGGTPTDIALDTADSVEALVRGPNAFYLAVYTIAINGPGSGSIRTLPFGGGTATTIVSGLAHPLSVALDGANVYWVDSGAGFGAVGSIGTARLDGSDVQTLASGLASGSIAVDDTSVYFTASGSIMKMDKAGGAASVFVGGLDTPGSLQILGGNLYWLNATVVSQSAVDPPYGVMTACK